MDISTSAEFLISIISAIGGWEAVKYFINRKTNKRKEEAEADCVEFKVLEETLAFLQRQLHDKEERFAQQTDRVRHLQDDYFTLMREKQKIELELQKYRCIRPKCMQREPQNGY